MFLQFVKFTYYGVFLFVTFGAAGFLWSCFLVGLDFLALGFAGLALTRGAFERFGLAFSPSGDLWSTVTPSAGEELLSGQDVKTLTSLMLWPLSSGGWPQVAITSKLTFSIHLKTRGQGRQNNSSMSMSHNLNVLFTENNLLQMLYNTLNPMKPCTDLRRGSRGQSHSRGLSCRSTTSRLVSGLRSGSSCSWFPLTVRALSPGPSPARASLDICKEEQFRELYLYIIIMSVIWLQVLKSLETLVTLDSSLFRVPLSHLT